MKAVPYPVECKAAAVVKGTHLKGIKGYLSYYAMNTGFIISLAPFNEIQLDNGIKIINIPLYSNERLNEVLQASAFG